ncbi:MAG: FimB/Mfa2 family fimbrial subunit [Rikenella sp.]|nr:FimB/Mfa2 family fimbrial subunit [Rikenella sp.]
MMKRSILAVVATTAAVVSFSCKKEKQPEPVLVSSAVEVTLGAPTSKAFGDDKAEDFEKEVQNIVMFVYKAGDNACAYQHEFTAFELSRKKAVFQIPGMMANTAYDFYAIANCKVSQIGNMPSRPNLLAAAEGRDVPGQGTTPYFGTLSDYNGRFEDVIAKALRSYEGQNGFIMSGTTTETSPAAGQNIPTKVKVELRRTVAKVMVEVKVSEEFKKKYEAESKLQFKNASLTNLIKNTPLVPRDGEPSLGTGDKRDRALEQEPYAITEYEHYQNQFFIYENGVDVAPAANLQPELVLDALFDFDGNLSTSGDQSNIKYTIKLAGAADDPTNTSDSKFGLFKRNGSYKINVSVYGLTENEVVATVEVMDWETLKTQDISIGEKN